MERDFITWIYNNFIVWSTMEPKNMHLILLENCLIVMFANEIHAQRQGFARKINASYAHSYCTYSTEQCQSSLIPTITEREA